MQGNGTDDADPLLTVGEAAARLHLSRATVYALCENGDLRHVRLATHSIRICNSDLLELIARRRR